MGEGQSKPSAAQKAEKKSRTKERKADAQDLQDKDLADLAARCVPKGLREEKAPRNAPPPEAVPQAGEPVAVPLPAQAVAMPPSNGPSAPQQNATANLVRSDSNIVRVATTSGQPQALVRSNSNYMQPAVLIRSNSNYTGPGPLVRSSSNYTVKAAPVQHALVRSNSSIVLSSNQDVRPLERSDSNVTRVRAVQEQSKVGRANSLIIKKPAPANQQAPSFLPPPAAASAGLGNIGRTASVVVPKPAGPTQAPLTVPMVVGPTQAASTVPPVGGYPKAPAPQQAVQTQAALTNAPRRTASMVRSSVRPRAQSPSATVSVPTWIGPPAALRQEVVQATPAAMAPPATDAKHAPPMPNGSLTAPILKVRASPEERDMLARSVLQAPKSSDMMPSPIISPTQPPASTPMTLKWTPPPEALPAQAASPDKGHVIRSAYPVPSPRPASPGPSRRVGYLIPPTLSSSMRMTSPPPQASPPTQMRVAKTGPPISTGRGSRPKSSSDGLPKWKQISGESEPKWMDQMTMENGAMDAQYQNTSMLSRAMEMQQSARGNEGLSGSL